MSKKIFVWLLIAALGLPPAAPAGASAGTEYRKLWMKRDVNWIRYTTVYLPPVRSEVEAWGRETRDSFEQMFLKDPLKLFQIVDEKREHALIVEITLSAAEIGGRPGARIRGRLTDAWTGEILVLISDEREIPGAFGALADLWGAELVRLLREARGGKTAGRDEPFDLEA
jgi:hypothetical protein